MSRKNSTSALLSSAGSRSRRGKSRSRALTAVGERPSTVASRVPPSTHNKPVKLT